MDFKTKFGLLTFAVLDEDGHKLGKSSGAPVWLCPTKTSAFEFYQYFFRIPDDQAEKMLNLFSFLSQSEIQVRFEDGPKKRQEDL